MHSEDQETRKHDFKMLFYRIIHNKQIRQTLVIQANSVSYVSRKFHVFRVIIIINRTSSNSKFLFKYQFYS